METTGQGRAAREMSELFEDDGPEGAGPGGNAPEFTVSELSGAVKRTIEGSFSHVRVRAEIGRVSFPRSGHIYYDLKDDRAVINAVTWKGQAARLDVRPEEGLEVIATGRMTTFPGGSRYQIIVESLEVAGAGALMAQLEKRRQALAAEGLFDEGRKQALPFLPEIIGVVTSPSGAVIRDILHRLRDRFPRKVLIWPVAVQGKGCAPEVARAIAGFNALTPGGALPRPDLIIVARGGGSVEDLWGFNEEEVVRAAAASTIPLISAVGHETDTTLIDFAADWRAPTPTAAAEKAVPVRMELLGWLAEIDGRLTRALGQGMAQRRQRMTDLARGLGRPEALTEGARQRLDQWGERLPGALRAAAGRKSARLAEAGGALRPGLLRRGIDERGRALASRAGSLDGALSRHVAQNRRDFDALAARLDGAALGRSAGLARRELDQVSARLSGAGAGQLRRWQDRLAALERMRQGLGYTETLKRGYAVVYGDGKVVSSVAAAGAAGALEIEFSDGKMPVGGGEGAASPIPAAKPAAKPKTKPKPDAPDQGSLF